MWAAVEVRGRTPIHTPVPSGTFGVRSPSKKGISSRPSAPASTDAAASESAA
jgi:hypothetical protein